MGTHISRVKSVDLDSWTDEQLQSVLRWGNARANKYWEAKLAPGHVPSEAKIENFIRTKYESKRWTMEGPIPDPATLDAEGDDDVPLSLVKEKHALDRTSSQRVTSVQPAGPSQVRRAQQPDLFAEDNGPSRANTTSPSVSKLAPKTEAAAPRQTKPVDSLLGLDFFGTSQALPANRPASAAATPGPAGQSRPDLKQSILSLYASVPKPQPSQQHQHAPSASFGGLQSPPPQHSQAPFGGLNDAFSGLSFGGPTSPPLQQNPKPSAFSGLGNIANHRSTPSQVTSPAANHAGGSFFDAKPTAKISTPLSAPSQPPLHSRAFSSSSGFGAFGSASSPVHTAPAAINSGLGDLFDFGGAAPSASATKPLPTSPPAQTSSVFNLNRQPSIQSSTTRAPAPTSSGWGSNTDAWGSNDAWSTSDMAPAKPTAAPPLQTSSNDFGWGSGNGSLANQSIVPGGSGGFSTSNGSPPKVSADEDFGGWSSAAPVTPAAGGAKPATSFAASEDLFSNVWE